MTDPEHPIRTANLMAALAKPCSWWERELLGWMYYRHWDAWHESIAIALDRYGGTVKWRAFCGCYDEEFDKERQERAKREKFERAKVSFE